MPYNNTPIPPPEDYNGTNFLPLARVQKIIASDEQVENCSKNAAFAIAIAAEEFIWYLVQQTQNVSKSERRGSRNKTNLQYKDIANAVARHDNLEFLADAVPTTISFSKYKELKRDGKSKGAAVDATASVPLNGQRTINDMTPGQPSGHDVDQDVDMHDASSVAPTQHRDSLNGHTNGQSHTESRTTTVPERPATSDSFGRPAVFDVVRNGFQSSPDGAIHNAD